MFYRIYKLTMMQLGEKLNVSVVHDKKSLLVQSLKKLMGIILLTFLIFIILFVIKSLLHIKIDIKLFILILMALQFISIISTTNGLINTMYLAKDNELLFSYPVKANEVFMSKIAVYVVYELFRNLTFLIPFLTAFALNARILVPFAYYLQVIPIIFILSLLPALIGVLLSIPVTFITKWLKERPAIAAVLVLSTVGVVFYGLTMFTASLPENFALIGMFNKFYNATISAIDSIILYGLYTINLANMMLSVSFLKNFGIILGLTFGLIGLAYFISRPIYFKMAVGSYEFSNKRKYSSKNLTMNKPFLSAFSKEFKLLRRSSGTFIGIMVTLVTLPIVLYLFNSIVGMFDLRIKGENISLAFNIFLGLIVLSSANSSSATGFSKEGGQAYLLKVTPLSIRKQAVAKIVFQLVLSSLVLGLTSIAIYYTTDITGLNMLYMFILFLLINIGHILWSLEMDFLDPQFKLHEANEDAKDNKNIGRSVVTGIAIAVVVAIYAFLSLNRSITIGWIKLFVVAILFLGIRVYLFVNRLHVYHKRIEI